MEIFAKRIRDRAAELGLSLAQVARKADVSERSFAHYAADRSEPDLASLVRIARALGVTTDYLVGVEVRKGGDKSDGGLARQRIAATVALLDAPALAAADTMLASLLEMQRDRGRK
jgi:transcriptional regulator with XRE-family HTH domain